MRRQCPRCGALLTGDEIALHRKLISRAATEYFCLDCLAQHCSATRAQLQSLIDYYHRTGVCTLFVRQTPPEEP